MGRLLKPDAKDSATHYGSPALPPSSVTFGLLVCVFLLLLLLLMLLYVHRDHKDYFGGAHVGHLDFDTAPQLRTDV